MSPSSSLVSTLVVGGEHSFVQRKLTPQLARHGLAVDAHWEWKKRPGAFPESSQIVFVLTDMASHLLNNAAVFEAWRRGVPVIYGGRKWAHNKALLERAGFPFSGPVETKKVQEVSPPPKEAPTMSVSKSESARTSSDIYTFYLNLLAKEATLTNAEAFRRALLVVGEDGGPSPFRTERPDVLATVRKDLKINLPRGKSAAWATLLPPVVEVVAPPVVEVVAPRVVEVVAPRVVEVVAPSPVSADLLAAVQLLRQTMEVEGITQITLTSTGIALRRIVVVEESFAL